MTGVRADLSELRRLEVDLGRVPAAAEDQVRKVLQKAALNIKTDLQSEAVGSESFARVAASISYETYAEAGGWVAEIGPEVGNPRGHARSQGGLAWIAYEGSARTAPVFPDPAGALDREAEAFRAYLGEAVAGEFL